LLLPPLLLLFLLLLPLSLLLPPFPLLPLSLLSPNLLVSVSCLTPINPNVSHSLSLTLHTWQRQPLRIGSVSLHACSICYRRNWHSWWWIIWCGIEDR